MAIVLQITFSSSFFMKTVIFFFIKIALKYVPNGPINNDPVLVQIMAWHKTGNKPLSEPMMAYLETHICIIGSDELIHCGLSGLIMLYDAEILVNMGSSDGYQTALLHRGLSNINICCFLWLHLLRTRQSFQCQDGVLTAWISHYKDTTVLQPSYLHNMNPFTLKIW